MDKTLVINGPEGTGKTLLARATARKMGPFVTTTLDRVLSGRLPEPGPKARTVIVEDLDGTNSNTLARLKALVSNGLVQVKGGPPKKTPAFIFVTQARNPLKQGMDDRRFKVLDLTEVLTPEQALTLADAGRAKMTNVEYLLKVDTIRREAAQEVQRLGREYAFDNSPIRVGDIVQDHKGLIVVAEIGVFYADVPYCLYSGERITQKGAPFIRGGERTVHQCNVTRYKAAGRNDWVLVP